MVNEQDGQLNIAGKVWWPGAVKTKQLQARSAEAMCGVLQCIEVIEMTDA